MKNKILIIIFCLILGVITYLGFSNYKLRNQLVEIELINQKQQLKDTIYVVQKQIDTILKIQLKETQKVIYKAKKIKKSYEKFAKKVDSTTYTDEQLRDFITKLQTDNKHRYKGK